MFTSQTVLLLGDPIFECTSIWPKQYGFKIYVSCNLKFLQKGEYSPFLFIFFWEYSYSPFWKNFKLQLTYILDPYCFGHMLVHSKIHKWENP